MSRQPHVLLLGGGHAMLPTLLHAREWTHRGLRVTLVDPQPYLYYSGMVPEYLGGVYQKADLQIDLARLARRAGATFVQEKAAELDPDGRQIATDSGTAYAFDVLAIDVGSVNPTVPHPAVATKPIHRIQAIEPPIQETLADPTASLRLVVVGGGAAGVEIALNVTGRFDGADRRADLDLILLEQANRILPDFPAGMGRYASQLVRGRGGSVHTETAVESVEARDGDAAVELVAARGRTSTVSADVVIWATGAVGGPLLRESGLSTDEHGFLHVTRELRTPSHPRIFAAGDCATIPNANLAKVGVHAVKQGSTLRANLDRTLKQLDQKRTLPSSSELASFRPYPVAPLILSTGMQEGLWTAGPLWAAHRSLLRVKHWIDRRWVRMYAPNRWEDASWRTLIGAESARDGPR